VNRRAGYAGPSVVCDSAAQRAFALLRVDGRDATRDGGDSGLGQRANKPSVV
jgi:hypothetical protein